MRRAIVLGLVQGPTEMAPVSSSAHISMLRWIWDRDAVADAAAGAPPSSGAVRTPIAPHADADAGAPPSPEAAPTPDADDAAHVPPMPDAAAQRKSLEVALHGGGALALALVLGGRLRRDWRRMASDGSWAPPRRVALIALSLAPPSFAGYRWERSIEQRLGGPKATATGLVLGAAAMALADTREPVRTLEQARPLDGVGLGLAQAAALIPGVSRRGATLAAARARGFRRRDADALSWLTGLPVLLAAVTLKGVGLSRRERSRQEREELLAGAAAAFASTLVSALAIERSRLGTAPLGRSCAYRLALALLILRATRARAPRQVLS